MVKMKGEVREGWVRMGLSWGWGWITRYAVSALSHGCLQYACVMAIPYTFYSCYSPCTCDRVRTDCFPNSQFFSICSTTKADHRIGFDVCDHY